MRTTSWFTFGQAHSYVFNGVTLDRNSVVEIEAEDPRAVMHSFFGDKWSMQYDDPPDKRMFPGRWVKIKC